MTTFATYVKLKIMMSADEFDYPVDYFYLRIPKDASLCSVVSVYARSRKEALASLRESFPNSRFRFLRVKS